MRLKPRLRVRSLRLVVLALVVRGGHVCEVRDCEAGRDAGAGHVLLWHSWVLPMQRLVPFPLLVHLRLERRWAMSHGHLCAQRTICFVLVNSCTQQRALWAQLLVILGSQDPVGQVVCREHGVLQGVLHAHVATQ